MGVRRSLTGALAAPLLLLAACGSGSSSIADPPISPSSPSSTTAAPHRESPEHFIRRWANAEKRMENTGKTKAYLALSQQCESCRDLAARVDGFYTHGGYVKWQGRKIYSLNYYGQKHGAATYAVHVHSAPTTYKRSSDAPEEHLPGGRSTELITIRRAGAAWEVVNFATLAA